MANDRTAKEREGARERYINACFSLTQGQARALRAKARRLDLTMSQLLRRGLAVVLSGEADTAT